MDNPKNINYKSLKSFSKKIDLLTLNNKGKTEDFITNFKAILDAQNLKGGINVFTKESGIYRLDKTFLLDFDIISLLNKSNFPIGLRTRRAFADLFAKKGDRINLFKENIEKTDLDTSRSYIREVVEAIEFDSDFLSYITDKEERKKVTLKIWETWLQCVYYQGTIIKKGRYVIGNILVFQGRQDIGKTRFFSLITPKGLFITDNNFLKKGDDFDPKITALICEIDDFDSMSKREFSNVKNFVYKNEDFYRKPYSKEPLRYPRVTTFIGTTPYKSAMLRNYKNKQFWICKVKKFNFDILNKILPTEDSKWKLWKEVSSWYKGREQLFKDIEWMNSIFRRINGKV